MYFSSIRGTFIRYLRYPISSNVDRNVNFHIFIIYMQYLYCTSGLVQIHLSQTLTNIWDIWGWAKSFYVHVTALTWKLVEGLHRQISIYIYVYVVETEYGDAIRFKNIMSLCNRMNHSHSFLHMYIALLSA